MTFADQLKHERARLGLTRAEAASLLKDVSASWIDKAERGAREPHPWIQEVALTRLRSLKSPRKAKGQNSEIADAKRSDHRTVSDTCQND